MAIEHWVTLVPDTKSLEKGIAKALAPVEKPVEVEVTADKGKAERSGRDAGKAIDKGAQSSTKDTGKEVGAKIDRGTRDATKTTGKGVGEAVDKGAKDATKNTGKDVGTKIGKDLEPEAKKAGEKAGTAMGGALDGALGRMVNGIGSRAGAILGKAMAGDFSGAANDVSSTLAGISGGLESIQNITGSDNFIGRGLGRLRDVVDNASSSVGGLAEAFSSVSSGIGAISDTTDAAQQLVDAFKNAKDGISGVSDLLGALEKRAPSIAAALSKIAGPMIEIAGAAYGVDWIQNHLPESMQGREPTINKDLGPNQGAGLSGRSWMRDFTHPWEVPQRMWRNWTQDDAGSDGPVAKAGGAGADGPVPDAGGGLGEAINSALEGSAPGFDYKPGDSLGDAINDALSGEPPKSIRPDDPEINEYRIGGGLGDAIRDAQKLDKEAKEARQAADKAQKEADRAAKVAERAEAKDKREADRAAKAAQREADKAQREADRAAKAAQRESDKAQREAARGGGGSGGGGGGRGSSSTGGVGSPVSGIGGGMGGNVAAMMALAQSASGRTKYGPASDLAGGLADCSGAISDLVEVLDTGTSSPNRLFTTMDFASDEQAAKFGFLPGYMPGALNIGVNPYPGQSGHMAATLPNGVNFESGGGTGGGAQYGGNAAGALDKQFEKHYYRPVGGVAGAFGGGVDPSNMPGFYAWVVPMKGDGAAAMGGSPGGRGGSAGGGFGGGASGSGNSILDQLRNIGEGGAKETLLPTGFSDPTTWPTVKSGLALLNIFGGMLGKPPGQGGMGDQGLIGDTRNLAPGELNPAITAGGSASLMGGAADMMTQLTQGGVAQPGAGNTTIDQSTNFNGNVDGDVSKGMAKANQARTAGAQGLKLTGPRVLS